MTWRAGSELTRVVYRSAAGRSRACAQSNPITRAAPLAQYEEEEEEISSVEDFIPPPAAASPAEQAGPQTQT